MENEEWNEKWGDLWGQEDKAKYILHKNNDDRAIPYSIYTDYKEFVILEIFDKKESDYVLSKMIENGVRIVDSLDEVEFKKRERYKSLSDWIKDNELVRDMLLKGHKTNEIFEAMILPNERTIEDQIEYLTNQGKYPPN